MEEGLHTEPLLVDVPEAMRQLACGRTYIYELLGKGELPFVKLGRATRIPTAEIRRFVEARIDRAA
jgi:excisionase family DNA binding protein